MEPGDSEKLLLHRLSHVHNKRLALNSIIARSEVAGSLRQFCNVTSLTDCLKRAQGLNHGGMCNEKQIPSELTTNCNLLLTAVLSAWWDLRDTGSQHQNHIFLWEQGDSWKIVFLKLRLWPWLFSYAEKRNTITPYLKWKCWEKTLWKQSLLFWVENNLGVQSYWR